MTYSNPRARRGAATGGTVMGEHPEPETDEVEQVEPPRNPIGSRGC